MTDKQNEPTLVDHLSKLEKTLHDAIIGTGEEQPEENSGFVPMPELDSLDSYEVKLAVQLFLFLKQRLQKEAYTINCRFDGWQERVNNYPLPMFTDNMTKTTKTVDPAVLILSETNKVLKDIRLEYMKRKGA